MNFRSVRVHFIRSRYNGTLIFQQDGAPSHFSRHVRDFLNQHYHISHIKSIVYSEEIASCEQLNEKIIVAFHTLKQSNVRNTLESVHRNLIRRTEVCVRQNGQHFQQFL